MEEIEVYEEDENPPPPTSPFWLKSTKKRRRFRITTPATASSIFFNTGLFVAILSISACLLLLLAVPSFISYTQQVIRPSSVKKGWDSVNLLLVAFAIVCAFLGKKDGQETPRNNNSSNINIDINTNTNVTAGDEVDPSSEVQFDQFQRRQGFESSRTGSFRDSFRDSRRWYGGNNMDGDGNYNKFRDMYGNDSENVMGITRLRRTSSSYPDLSQVYYDQEMRSYAYDDSYVRYYNYPAPVESVSRPSPVIERGVRSGRVVVDDQVKDIEVDSSINHHSRSEVLSDDIPQEKQQQRQFPPQQLPVPAHSPSIVQPQQQPSTSSSLTPPLPSRSAMVKVKKATVMKEEASEHRGDQMDRLKRRQAELRKIQVHVPPSARRSPSPPQASSPPHQQQTSSTGYDETEGKSSRRIKKRGSATTTKKDIFTTIYQQSKRKMKQKRKSHENLDEIYQSSSSNYTPLFPPPSPPPPPPPPPPPLPRSNSVLQTVFSTKKSKGKDNIIHSTSQSIQHPSTHRSTKSRTVTSRKPPIRDTNYDPEPSTLASNYNQILTGNESPLIPIPPPPPPPFKMKPWKFVLKGDYVKLIDNNSNDSPRSFDSDASPSHSATSSPANGSDQRFSGALFCPSPDVNMKADDFIARFRSNLKLEKMDSIQLSQGGVGLSPLRGPDSSPRLLRT